LKNLKSSAKKAFIWDFFGKFGKLGMGFIFSIFLARLLEPSDFGLIAMIMVIVTIADVFTDLGLGGALIQRQRLHMAHYSSVFYFNIFIGTILSLITFFSADYIADFYNNKTLIHLTQIISLTFIIGALNSIQTIQLRKELNYALLTKLTFVSSLTSGILGILLAFYGAGVWSLIAQTLSYGIIYTALVWNASRWRPDFLFSFKALMQLWGFGFRMFLVILLDAVFSRLDFIIIGKLFTPATLGYYQRGRSLNEMVINFSSSTLMRVMFPVLSKIQNDLARFQNVIVKLSGIIIFITFMIMGTLYLISEELIILLFSAKWMPSVVYFQILVLSGVFQPINALLVNVLSSRGNSKDFLKMAMLKKLVLAINLFVGFSFGIESFLYGLIIAAFINTIITIIFVSREINLTFTILFKPIIIQIIISVLAAICTQYIFETTELESILLLIAKASIFILIYFIVNIIFKTRSYTSFVEQFNQLRKGDAK
jgi:O-antigen/teichoic acid export membrane protein